MIKFFTQFPGITAVMSEKEDGSMKIVDDEIIWKQNQKNRRIFFEKTGIGVDSVVSAKLVHGDETAVVGNAKQKIISGADALITKEKGIFLAVTAADCVPVFFYDSKKDIIALAHAGWKGVVGKIIENSLRKLQELGTIMSDLHVALGPAIGKCHFEIKEDILGEFLEYDEFVIRKDERIFVDIKGIIMEKLNTIGIPKENIENDPTCTYCNENLFSYRRDKPETAEAMIAVIGMRKE